MRIAPTLGACLSLLFVAAGCSTSTECTLLACENGARYQSPVKFAGATDSLTVTACKNGACARGAATRSNCSITGTVDAACTVSIDAAGVATIAFTVGAGGKPEDFANGDIYTFKVERPQTNETLVDVTKAATYKTAQPNGPSCAPTCKFADLT